MVAKDEPRRSVQAMEESEKFKDTVAEATPQQKEEAQRNLEGQPPNSAV